MKVAATHTNRQEAEPHRSSFIQRSVDPLFSEEEETPFVSAKRLGIQPKLKSSSDKFIQRQEETIGNILSWGKRWFANGIVINYSSRRVRVWSSDAGLYWIEPGQRSAISGEDVDHVQDHSGQWFKIGFNYVTVDRHGNVLGAQCRASGPGLDCSSTATTPERSDLDIDRPSSVGVQTKLIVGAPDDPYEQEADAMAEHVMRMPLQPEEAPVISRINSGKNLQRMCSECEEEMQVQRICSDCEEETAVQRAENRGGEMHASSHIAGRLQSRQGQGSILPPALQAQMGQSFGTDFSNVRIHTDAEAAKMSQDLNALAFTHGSDIYFNQGKYDPGSSGGQRLLAHELTHTVQQNTPDIIHRQVIPEDIDISLLNPEQKLILSIPEIVRGVGSGIITALIFLLLIVCIVGAIITFLLPEAWVAAIASSLTGITIGGVTLGTWILTALTAAGLYYLLMDLVDQFRIFSSALRNVQTREELNTAAFEFGENVGSNLTEIIAIIITMPAVRNLIRRMTSFLESRTASIRPRQAVSRTIESPPSHTASEPVPGTQSTDLISDASDLAHIVPEQAGPATTLPSPSTVSSPAQSTSSGITIAETIGPEESAALRRIAMVERMETIVSDANLAIADAVITRNSSFLRRYLRPREVRRLLSPQVPLSQKRMIYGRAVEFRTAEVFGADPILSTQIRIGGFIGRRGRIGQTTPSRSFSDFEGTPLGELGTIMIDVTTELGVSSHLQRLYLEHGLILRYTRPSTVGF